MTKKKSAYRRFEDLLRPMTHGYASSRVFMLLGYAMARQHLSRAEMVDRGYINRRQAYQNEADIRKLFGVEVGEIPADWFAGLFEQKSPAQKDAANRT